MTRLPSPFWVTLLLLAMAYTLQSLTTTVHKDHCLRSGPLVLDSLYEGNNGLFSSSGSCDHCHGHDANGLASVDLEGSDVNVVDAWRSTMMANSAKDPYWRAKVSEEVSLFPQHQQAIESTCTRCHAPLGHYDALADGATTYSINAMLQDPVALDGVSCLACHQQLPQTDQAQHTGHLFYDPTPHAYGPYVGPLVTPMALNSGYTPEVGAHISDSKLCAGCHSLVTETVDNTGNLNGNLFVEQATWHEWLNSSYPSAGTTCQSCHLPQLGKQSIVLAAGYDTPPRTPFGLHLLTGGNTTMLRLMRDNKEDLGIVAELDDFEASINSTIHNLTEASCQVQIQEVTRTADSVYIAVRLRNLTGHKLPSGYPSRRVSVHLTCEDEGGQLVFQSGGFDESGQIMGESLPFEPHHQKITNADDVQIYEMVMGDVNGQKTNVLNRAATHLKDNRLVPLGFGYNGSLYDTTEVVLGMLDVDFNNDQSLGSGTDIVHYAVASNGNQSSWNIQVEVYYQALPPHWTSSLLQSNTPEIEAFGGMLQNADLAPQLMESVNYQVPAYIGINETDAAFVWCNTKGHSLEIQSRMKGRYAIYSVHGSLIAQGLLLPERTEHRDMPTAGEYLIVCTLSNGRQVILRSLVAE